MKAIRDEDEARRVKIAAERRAAMVMFALQPIEPPTAGFEVTTVSRFEPNPSTPSNIDLERRRRLLELHNEAFPDGSVPDPFAVTWPGLDEDAAANKLLSSSLAYRCDKRYRHVRKSPSIRF
ncbi:hypothetical protein GALMADRAFT_223907 [Galerina marginata CBS 339.88]|uniref:Uncharacterized protein n=1 Tax=Galerina marginata (strain CBS 339.88) TaxID=685588 RepID=A0A067TFG5_GALM3|nr:hypothetical protein GALMADRAFT_223907 [Galerina marginata CBS 339.88]